MKIAIGNDHAGTAYKFEIVKQLEEKGFEIVNHGTDATDSVDYPDFAHKLAKSIEKGENKLGIQFCGTGNGINMSANKHQGIRAALCWNTHIAEQARLHNNANILTMPARHLQWEEVKSIVDIFLETNFEGGRHLKRVEKIRI